MTNLRAGLSLFLVLGGLATNALSTPEPTIDFDQSATSIHELLGALVAANTSNPPGNEARAVAIGAARLDAVGIPYQITQFAEGRQNLVARVAGDGTARPLLLLAHIDVVGAGQKKWATNPHVMTLVDGFLTARGVADDLGMAATELDVLTLIARRDRPLARDVILAWTGDEESGGAGIRWLLEHERESIHAEIVLNEGGGIRLGPQGQVVRIDLQTAEKTYQDFTLVAHGTTGHSSVPLPDNAIYRLAHALTQIEKYRFPARLLPVTRASLSARGRLEGGALGTALIRLAESSGPLPADALASAETSPVLSAGLRTTCVATQLEGGSRANALAAEARATLNCRILPHETVASVQTQLIQAIDDPTVEIQKASDFGRGGTSPIEAPTPRTIRKVARELWPDIEIVPFMSRGATDSRFLRAEGMAAYGISPIPITERDTRRAHGINERIPESSLRTAVEFLYRVVVAISAVNEENH